MHGVLASRKRCRTAPCQCTRCESQDYKSISVHIKKNGVSMCVLCSAYTLFYQWPNNYILLADHRRCSCANSTWRHESYMHNGDAKARHAFILEQWLKHFIHDSSTPFWTVQNRLHESYTTFWTVQKISKIFCIAQRLDMQTWLLCVAVIIDTLTSTCCCLCMSACVYLYLRCVCVCATWCQYSVSRFIEYGHWS